MQILWLMIDDPTCIVTLSSMQVLQLTLPSNENSDPPIDTGSKYNGRQSKNSDPLINADSVANDRQPP